MIWPDGVELGEAPRRVPKRLKWTLQFGRSTGVIGLVFFVVGLSAVGGLAIGSDIVTTILLSDGGKTADGFVIGFEESNVEVNGETVMGVRYRFEVDGTQYEGQSYSLDDLPNMDEKILVEYVRSSPHRSRIIGMDAGAVPLWLALIFSIFLIVGAALLSTNYRTGRRWAYLLEWGVETDGKVIDQKSTGVTVNSESQFEMTLSYNDDTGAHHRASMRTFIPEDLLDEPRETILYDRRAPHRSIAVDGLPDIVRLTKHGHFAPPPSRQVTGVLFLLGLNLLIGTSLTLLAFIAT